ncbi:hypothetical protein PENSTE_c015G04130 [Penicillium steckii]|uniref:Uncharacterized protein n=1 Tax=Penicillium steckii TaxID=303698 RepID=A0A1V6T0H5_9EURO|nr:hypothetical protein PENSTE_c015G04130 [Penicillium steckii]
MAIGIHSLFVLLPPTIRLVLESASFGLDWTVITIMAPAHSKIEPPSSCGLNPMQRAEVKASIHSAIEELRKEIMVSINASRSSKRAQKKAQSPDGFPRTPANVTISDSVKASNWVTSEIGYFLPDSTRDEHVRMVQDSLYFSNVLAFVTYIRAMTTFKNESTIAVNLSSCLRGEALDWLVSEVSQSQREKLRSLSLEEGWIKSLMCRFKTPPSHASRLLKKSRYTWADVRNQRSLVMWAHNMLRIAGESKEYPEVWQQLHAVWDQIEIPIRGNVEEPSSETTVAKFMEELDGWYNLWR